MRSRSDTDSQEGFERYEQKLVDGRYRIVEPLGKGGMCRVLAVRPDGMDRIFAIKILPPGANPMLVKRFKQEIRLLSRIQHPNVIEIIACGTCTDLDPEGVLYYVMKRVEGRNLKEILEAHGALPETRALRIVRQVAAGVAAAHEAHVLHRDLKPANIMIGRDLCVTVLDFGIAKVRRAGPDGHEVSPTTHKAGIWATPEYMSPEQADAQTELDERTDVYSLGVVMYEMLSGQLPFIASSLRMKWKRMNTRAILTRKHLYEQPKRLAECGRDLSPGICDLVMDMLEKKRDDRPSSMTKIRERIDGILPPESSSPPIMDPLRPPESVPAAPAPTITHHGRGSRFSLRRGRTPALFVGQGVLGGATHVIHDGIVEVGRALDNDIILGDDLVSRHHAVVTRRGSRLILRDLGSANGVEVDGREISGEEVDLRGGTLIILGRIPIRVGYMRDGIGAHFGICENNHTNEVDDKFCAFCAGQIVAHGRGE